MDRYGNIQVIKTQEGKRLYRTVLFPEIPLSEQDLYVITVVGDRYDLLANTYYKDKTLYWIIPRANNLPCDSLFPPEGVQLRIPVDVSAILREYSDINRV